MPLDQPMANLMDDMVRAGARPMGQHSLGEARRSIATAAPRSEEMIEEIKNLEVPGPYGPIPLRLYRPRTGPRLPALVFFHGGGWVLGSIDTHDAHCRFLANQTDGAVLSVGYRCAPEHQFPAAAEDAYAATSWIADHAHQLGIDSKRIGVAGDSAGGNLAAVVSLMARDRGCPHLQYQLLRYPVLNHSFATESYSLVVHPVLLTKADMQWFWGHYLPHPSWGNHPYASPLVAATFTQLPPTIIVIAEFDPLRDEAEEYAVRLRESGVDVTVLRGDGMIHGFFGMTHAVPAARAIATELGECLQAATGQPSIR